MIISTIEFISAKISNWNGKQVLPNERLMCMDIESLKIPCDLNSRFYTLNGESTNIKDFAIELNNVYLKITLKEDN